MKYFNRSFTVGFLFIVCAVLVWVFYERSATDQCEVLLSCEDGRTLVVKEPSRISFDEAYVRMEFPRNSKDVREFLYPREGKQISVSIAGVLVFDGKSRVSRDLDPGGEPVRMAFPTGSSTLDIVRKLKSSGVSIEYLTYEFR